MKNFIGFLLLLSIFLYPELSSGQRSSRSSFKFYNSPKSHSYSSQTYNIGGTHYRSGETYKTTGMPKVERSASARNQFLRSQGYRKAPKGYEVDHITPLSKGGQDNPSNMQLLPKQAHKQKTARERAQR